MASNSDICQVLKDHYPEIEKEINDRISEKPDLECIELIPEIIREVDGMIVTNDRGIAKTMSIAIIIRLYEPRILKFNLRMKKEGLRLILSQSTGIRINKVSEQVQKARDYFSIYQDFRKQVISISDHISQCYSKR